MDMNELGYSKIRAASARRSESRIVASFAAEAAGSLEFVHLEPAGPLTLPAVILRVEKEYSHF